MRPPTSIARNIDDNYLKSNTIIMRYCLCKTKKSGGPTAVSHDDGARPACLLFTVAWVSSPPVRQNRRVHLVGHDTWPRPHPYVMLCWRHPWKLPIRLSISDCWRWYIELRPDSFKNVKTTLFDDVKNN